MNLEFNNIERSLIRQRNLEELSSEEIFASSTLRLIFEEAYWDKLSAIEDEKKRNPAIMKKLAIFADAIRRGDALVSDRLKGGDVFFYSQDGLRKKSYYYGAEGNLRWKIEPSSNDPFARLDFLNKAKENETELTNETDNIYTEEELARMVFREGKKEQDRIYSSFAQTVDLIDEAQNRARTVLPFVQNTRDVKFAEIMAINKALSSVDPDEKAEEFISGYVSINHPVLSRIEDAKTAAKSILALRALLKKQRDTIYFNEVLSDDQAIVAQNSLAVELLTNPQGVNMGTLKYPQITLNRVVRLYRAFLAVAQTEYRETAYLIAHTVISTQQERLVSLFEAEGIDPKVGLEYLQNLALNLIHALPGKSNIGQTILPNINNFFNLVDPVGGGKTENASKTPRITRSFESEALVKDFLERNEFSVLSFRSFAPVDRDRILQNILEKAKEGSGLKYKTALQDLIHRFGIRYKTPQDIVFDKADESMKLWIIPGRTFLIEYCLQAVSEADRVVVEILDHELVSGIVRQRLRGSLRGGDKRLFHKVSLFGKDREKAVREAVVDASRYALSEKYLGGSFDYSKNLADPIGRVMSNAYRSFTQSVAKNELGYDPILTSDLVELCRKALSYAERIVQEIKQQNLPSDYEEKKVQYMSVALQKALN